MNRTVLLSKLDNLATKAMAKNRHKPFQVLIHSDKHDLHFEYPPNSQHQIFHIASIGKLLTTVLVLQAVEAGKLSLETKLTDHLDPILLEGLFESDPHEITILDCLSHRSGAADFFEGKGQGKPFLEMIMDSPETLWTQEMLLEYTRTHMKPIGKRGEQFAYGDTGYLLVSMVMEKIEQKPLRIQLEESILNPLGMSDSQSMIYLYPKEQAKVPLDIWLGSHEVKNLKILSVDQADGGLVSTPFDLVLFQKALHGGKLISPQHLELMQHWQGKFRAGLHYGTGMMQVHFNEFFFLMRDYPKLIGHIGILSTHCFYDPNHDIHYILNFGSTESITRSFVFLSNVVGTLKSTLKT